MRFASDPIGFGLDHFCPRHDAVAVKVIAQQFADGVISTGDCCTCPILLEIFNRHDTVRIQVGPAMQITHSSKDPWHIVTVTGEIDLYTAPALRDGLAQSIESGALHLAVDLRPVPFMDSMGLGVLIGARRRLSERDGQIALVCEEGPVRRVLDVSGLATVFEVVRSLDELPVADAP